MMTMYGNSSARDILLLAAEDAFEFERWRDAGPVTADIDPEVKAAEIAEFEALGIPMPSELDSLRRELEHAPKVREAIRHSSLALRRSGRASASALVALGPQQLMPMGQGGMPWGWPMGVDPMLAARMAGYAIGPGAEPRRRSRAAAAEQLEPFADELERDQPEPSPRARPRKRGSAAVLVDDEPVEAEVVDGFDDDDDDDDDDDELEDQRPRRSRAREPERRAARRRAEPRRASAARRRDEWDDDDDDIDGFESAVAARPVRSDQKATWVLGGISVAAVLMLLWIAFDKDERPANDGALAQQQQPQQPLQQQAAPMQPAAPVEAVVGIDPATGLPLGQVAAPVEPAPAVANTSSGRRSSGGSSRSSSSGSSSSGGVINPFASVKAEEAGVLASKPTAPANSGTTAQPAAGGAPPPPGAGVPAPATPDQAATTPPSTEEPKPVEQPKPAEQPEPEEPQLTKSKMTP